MSNVTQAIRVIERAQAGDESLSSDVLRDAIENVVTTTGQTYTRQSASYAEVRQAQPWEWDVYIEGLLLGLVRSRISEGRLASGSRWRLLDVGAGYGRDVARLAEQSDIDPVALEYSEGFLPALRRLQSEGVIGPDAVIQADMRFMPMIPVASFQCVRNHATLHHLPVVRDGMGADAAVSETRRILVNGGVFYVLVKQGNGVNIIDTGEGLGGRFFQLFTRDLLMGLLERHGFSVVHLEDGLEKRSSGDVSWLFALAIAI